MKILRNCLFCHKEFKTRDYYIKIGGGKYCSRSCSNKATAHESWNKGKAMGLLGTSFYRSWQAMKKRCQNPKDSEYSRYGGRGITICNEWQIFSGFYKDMYASYEQGLSIDRIDNNKGYYKENCRWATAKEQANNTRNIERAARYTYNGLTLSIKEWAKMVGIKRRTLSQRLLVYKWSIKRALTKEVRLIG